MSKSKISNHDPYRFDIERLAVNGQLPLEVALGRLAYGFNIITGRYGKMIASYSQDWDNVQTATDNNARVWPCAWRSGPGRSSIIVRVGLVRADGFSAGAAPQFLATVKEIGTNSDLAAQKAIYFNHQATGTAIVPDEVYHGRIRFDDLPPNTEMRLDSLAVNFARPVYLCVYETPSAFADTSISPYCDPGAFEVDGEILDSGLQKLVTASNALWKQGGAHLLQYCGTSGAEIDSPGSGLGLDITGSTSYVDVAIRQPYIDTRYHDRITGGGQVPVTLAVCAGRTAGTGTLSVRITDGGSSAVEITGIGVGSFFFYSTASGSLAAQIESYTIQAKQSDAVTTHRLMGLACWE